MGERKMRTFEITIPKTVIRVELDDYVTVDALAGRIASNPAAIAALAHPIQVREVTGRKGRKEP